MTETGDEFPAAVEDQRQHSPETELLGAIALLLEDISESLCAVDRAATSDTPCAGHPRTDQSRLAGMVTPLQTIPRTRGR